MRCPECWTKHGEGRAAKSETLECCETCHADRVKRMREQRRLWSQTPRAEWVLRDGPYVESYQCCRAVPVVALHGVPYGLRADVRRRGTGKGET